MQFAIPHAPRAVKLSQVPGAKRRLGLFLLFALGLTAVVAVAARFASRAFAEDVAKLERSSLITGIFRDARLPPVDERDGKIATMSVLFDFNEERHSASHVPIHALDAEGLGIGAQVSIYVDPTDPDHPVEAKVLRERAARADLFPYGLALGLLLGMSAFAWELMRTFRREVDPLRKGAIVWLTPDEPLPDTKAEVVFKGHYFRDNQKYEVKARARPDRAPVRNGEKILAALMPKKPTWVRVVDEDLAKTLGWIR